MPGLRDAVPTDFERILRLNEAEEHLTSPLSRERLDRLVQISSYCKVATVRQETAAFLIAFREGVPYESENFGWFDKRLSRFLYIDRIVVGEAFTRQGVGSRLYRDLFAFARSQKVETVACEYNRSYRWVSLQAGQGLVQLASHIQCHHVHRRVNQDDCCHAAINLQA